MKKNFYIVLSALLVITMLAACGGGGQAPAATTAAPATEAATTAAPATEAATTAAPAAEAAEAATEAATTAAPATEAATTAAPETAAPEPAKPDVIEITAVLQIGSDIILENNPVVQAIEDATGVRMIIEAPPSDGYGDRVKILMATGDMPDLLHFGADIFAQQWSDEGLFLDVTDLIANYPNLNTNISREQYGDCIFLEDGRIYGIPKPNSYDAWGYLVNKKWLDALGLSVPKTIEDYVNVSRAFTFDDPDGNGVNDTYGGGLHGSGGGIWHMKNDFVSMAYSISNWHHGMPDADKSAKLRHFKMYYGDYMKLIRSMYEENILDREFITHNGDENEEKFAQQRTGFVGASQKGFTGVLTKYNLNLDDYQYCAPLILHEGDDPTYAMPPSNWMAYYVNSQSPKTDAVLRVLDYGNSEEGFVLMQAGIAGLNYQSYDIETRTITRTKEQEDEVKKTTGNMFAFANAYKNQPLTEGGTSPEAIAKWQAEAPAVDAVTVKCFFGFTKMIDKVSVQFPDDASALATLETRYITGEAPFEELMDFINGDYAAKVAPIARELEDYMAANPPRYVK